MVSAIQQDMARHSTPGHVNIVTGLLDKIKFNRYRSGKIMYLLKIMTLVNFIVQVALPVHFASNLTLLPYIIGTFKCRMVSFELCNHPSNV